jgi:uncharacterized protein YhbP (UPF0306 family)
MNKTEAKNIAQNILDTNIYMTIGTTDGKRPWVSPLFYCKDRKNRFYVISQPSSRHIVNISSNRAISFAIFDSHAPEGKGNGVQGDGSMKECRGKELEQALRYYHTDFIPCTKEALTRGPYRLYRIRPNHFYILDPEAPTDKRIEVKLRMQ